MSPSPASPHTHLCVERIQYTSASTWVLFLCFSCIHLSTSLPEGFIFPNSLFGSKTASNTYCSVSFPLFSILQVCQLLIPKNPLITGFGKIIHLGAQPQDTKNSNSQWEIEKMRSDWNQNQIKGKGVASFLALWWRNNPHTQVLPKERVLGQNTQLQLLPK